MVLTTAEDRRYKAQPFRDPASALYLDVEEAERLQAFLKNEYGRQVIEVCHKNTLMCIIAGTKYYGS